MLVVRDINHHLIVLKILLIQWNESSSHRAGLYVGCQKCVFWEMSLMHVVPWNTERRNRETCQDPAREFLSKYSIRLFLHHVTGDLTWGKQASPRRCLGRENKTSCNQCLASPNLARPLYYPRLWLIKTQIDPEFQLIVAGPRPGFSLVRLYH